jgi:putative tryptophan/tyrosine transport system substrate-binding protein
MIARQRSRRRRDVLGLLGGAAIGYPIVAKARTSQEISRIGVLSTTWGPTSPIIQSLRDGLKSLGYVEGQNLAIEVRSGEGRNDRLPALAAELVDRRVDLLVTGGPYALQAAKDATTTIPIVFAGVGANFAATQSGGNITGVAEEIVQSTGKRLLLLKEAVPSIARVAVLANPDNYGTRAYLEECRARGNAAGITLRIYDVRDPSEVSPAFPRMIAERAEGLLAFTDSILFGQRVNIVQTALKNRLPGIYPYREWVTGGGLLSFGPNLATIMRQQIPQMADVILKGAKASDAPVQQPRLELFVNLKTAKTLGITLPKPLLDRADELIE